MKKQSPKPQQPAVRRISEEVERPRLQYSDYVRRLAQHIGQQLDRIEVQHNFDYGPEFEIALCKVLRSILPQKYGVCRGFVVTHANTTVGDDVVVYDRENYPTLRLLDQNDFLQKELIPIEAVYAYIEAKHTLCIEGTGPDSLEKACKQVSAVKKLDRDPVEWITLDSYVQFPGFRAAPPENWPQTRNQLYGAVMARYVRSRKRGKRLDQADTIQLAMKKAGLGAQPLPDLIVAGPDVVCVPAINCGFYTPFFIEGKSALTSMGADSIAFGIGVCSLLNAIDMMRLPPMKWPVILGDALGLRTIRPEDLGNEVLTFRLPCYLIAEEERGMHLIQGTTGHECRPFFTDHELAARFLAAAQLTRSDVLTANTDRDLQTLARQTARAGIDWLVINPTFGNGGFLEVHVHQLLTGLSKSRAS